MSGLKVLGGAAAAVAFFVHGPVLAQQDGSATGAPQTAEHRDLATNTQLLAALLQRRVELAQSAVPNKAEALAFLDRQIVQVTSRIAEAGGRIGK